MTTRYRQYPPHAHPEGYRARLALACGIGLMLGAGPAPAQDGFCSAPATALLRAYRSEVKDDFFVAQAICINVSDDEGRRGCSGRARTARKEANKLCRQQRQGRLDACRSLGEGRYDPDFDPALYDDPKNPSNPNTFFPLRVGNRRSIRRPGSPAAPPCRRSSSRICSPPSKVWNSRGADAPDRTPARCNFNLRAAF